MVPSPEKWRLVVDTALPTTPRSLKKLFERFASVEVATK
jgi:hypothetical protein